MSARRRPTAKVAAFLAFVTAVLCPQGSAARFPAPAGGHLYACSFSPFEVQRYPVVRGVLQPMPDRTYGSVACPIAIGPDGNLLATNDRLVRAYGPDGGLRRSLVVDPPKNFPQISLFGLAVDALGYLYVSSEACNQSSNCVFGVRVYAPKATGHARPLFVFLQHGIQLAEALALGPGGELYTPLGAYILVWAGLHNDPDEIRALLTGPQFGGGQIAIDAVGEIYDGAVTNAAFCDVYKFASAERGKVKLDRILELNTNYFGCAVAVDDTHLYVESDPKVFTPSTLQEFYKLASGPAKPLATVTLPNGYYGDIRFGR